LFLLGGMAEVVFDMALRRKMVLPRVSAGKMFAYAAGLAIALVPLMYVAVLILNRLH